MGPRYWVRFKEADGGWTDWRECSMGYYARVRGRWDYDTACTYPGDPTP